MQRASALAWAARNTLRVLSARELKSTQASYPEAGVDRIHPLIEGIYKPAWSDLPLSVWSTHALNPSATEPYPDRLQFDADGVWFLDYHAKDGSPDSAVNRGLIACQERGEPVIVVLSEPKRRSSDPSLYRLQGLGLVRSFDPQSRLFHLTGFAPAESLPSLQRADPYLREILEVRARLANEFLIREPRPVLASMRKQRDAALRELVLHEYACQCAVCRAEFQLREPPGRALVEAQAAHVVPVEEDGSDDLRNTLSLCPRHHWAFDKGLFTVDETRRVLVSPAVLRARRVRFDLEEYDGQDLLKPNTPGAEPDSSALEWHRAHAFRAT